MIHWILFLIFVSILLAFDLGVFHKKDHVFNFKESMFWSVVWIAISCAFGAFMWYEYGAESGSQWFTAYVLEKSLSIDNLFVISLIFTFFATPAQYQHRCLYYGILGAIVMRGFFIIFGVALVSKFEWLLYLFGLFLIYSGFKIVLSDDEETKVEENGLVKYFKKHFKIYPNYDGHNFFIKSGKRYVPTLMFIVLLMIESTDIVFAVDSIPAALGVSNDSFILYSSNIMAVLGLRALYFVLLSIIDKFWMLKYGIGFVLCFIGVKMLSEHFVEITSVVSLMITMTILLGSIGLSLVFKNKKASAVLVENEDVKK